MGFFPESRLFSWRVLFLVLCLATRLTPSFAFEKDPRSFQESHSKSPLEVLEKLASEFKKFEQDRAVKAMGPNLSVAQDATLQAQKLYNLKSSQMGEQTENLESLGNIALPIAKVVEGDFSMSGLQKQKWGDLGGSPFGSLVGKSTFGESSQDQSIQNLIQNGGEDSFLSVFPDEGDPVEISESLTQEQMLEAQTREQNVRNEMDKLTFKIEPFQETNYKAYENAKELFKKNEKLISKISDFEEGFIRNAQELFVNFSWRDQDKVGKMPYEKFIERQERQLLFPDPTMQATTPKTHQGKKSH